MNKPVIVGLLGRSQSGKTSSAEAIAMTFGFERGVRVVDFFDPVRQMAWNAISAHLLHKYSYEKAKKELPWLRPLLVDLGMAFETHLPAFKHDHVTRAVHYAGVDGDELVIIPSLRWCVDCYFVKSLGGKIIYLQRGETNELTGVTTEDEPQVAADKYADFVVPKDLDVEARDQLLIEYVGGLLDVAE